MNNKKPRIINGLYIVDEIDTSPNGGVDAGYEQGLADAVAALENNVVRFSVKINGEWLINQKDAIAAIRALGVK